MDPLEEGGLELDPFNPYADLSKCSDRLGGRGNELRLNEVGDIALGIKAAGHVSCPLEFQKYRGGVLPARRQHLRDMRATVMGTLLCSMDAISMTAHVSCGRAQRTSLNSGYNPLA
jgi:hypothetical protein